MATLQVRDVPESVHRTLKARAALVGMSLSEYVLTELRASAERPTIKELDARIESRGRVTLPVRPADVLADARVGRS